MANFVPVTLNPNKLVVTTLVGSGAVGSDVGPSSLASFNHPRFTCLSPDGDLYIADWGNDCIKVMNKTGFVANFAGTGEKGFLDGPKAEAKFDNPFGMIFSAYGDLFIADTYNNRIRVLTKDGNVATFAGCGVAGYADGKALESTFQLPMQLAFNSSGDLFISDWANHRIRSVNSEQIVVTIAGSDKGFKDGPGHLAKFAGPVGIAFNSNGELLVADQSNHRIRIIDQSGFVNTFAGSGDLGLHDGPLLEANFHLPTCLCIAPNHDIFVSDQSNHRIRLISEGRVRIFAGSATGGYKEGLVDQALFNAPMGLTINSSGDLLITDYYNHRVRFIAGATNVSTSTQSGGEMSVAGLLSEIGSSLSDISFTIEKQTFKLHKTLLRIRCPNLLDQNILEIMEKSKISAEAFEALVGYIYDDSITLNSSPKIFFQLDILSNICGLKDLSEYVRTVIVKKLTSIQSIDELFITLGNVVNQFEKSSDIDTQSSSESSSSSYSTKSFNHSDSLKICEELVDLIVCRLRSQSKLVALKTEALASIIPVSNPLFLKLMGKLFSDSKLYSPPKDAISPFGKLARQIERFVPNSIKFPVKQQTTTQIATSSDPADSTQSDTTADSLSATQSPNTAPQTEDNGKDIQHDDSTKPQSSIASDTQESQNATVAENLVGATSPVKESSVEATSEIESITPVSPPDFTIISCGQEFEVHKWILLGRWSYFRKMISFGGAEFESSRMKLPSISPDSEESVFSASLTKSLLNYIYTNKVDQSLSQEDAVCILKNGVEFNFIDQQGDPLPGFTALVDYCRKPLHKTISIENCIDHYQMAQQIGSETQKRDAYTFIVRNFSKIMSSPTIADQFKSLGSALAIQIVFEHFGHTW